MSLKDATRYVNQAADTVEFVGVSGGEPFLFFDDLLKLSKHCQDRSLHFGIMTNGFWASSLQKTREKLGMLCRNGLSGLGLSCDVEHQKFVDKDNISNIIKVVSEFQLPLRIHCTHGKEVFKPPKLIEVPIDSEIVVEDYPALPNDASKPSDFGLSKYPLNYLARFGCSSLNCLEVHPDGSVYPCAAAMYLSPRMMIFGNLRREPLQTILDRIFSNGYLNIIEKVGFGRLVADFCKLGVKFPGAFTSFCHLCHFLLNCTDYEIFARVMRASEISFLTDLFSP